jgi:hypothetical protein
MVTNAPVMAHSRDLGWWFVRYGSKGEQVRLARTGPVRPKACDQHLMWWIWPEFENDVFVFLACSDFTALHSRAGHVLVKCADDDESVRGLQCGDPGTLTIDGSPQTSKVTRGFSGRDAIAGKIGASKMAGRIIMPASGVSDGLAYASTVGFRSQHCEQFARPPMGAAAHCVQTLQPYAADQHRRQETCIPSCPPPLAACA